MIKKYAESPTTASTGGLQPGVTEEQYAGPVGEAMFSAPKGKLEGPLKYTLGEIVFEVEKVTPEKVRPIGEAEAEIKTELEQKTKEQIFTGIHGRLPQQVAGADLLRLGLHDRKNLLELQGHPQKRRSESRLPRRKESKAKEPKRRLKPKAARRPSCSSNRRCRGRSRSSRQKASSWPSAAAPGSRITDAPGLSGPAPPESRALPSPSLPLRATAP